MKCTVDSCDGDAIYVSRGLCRSHYDKARYVPRPPRTPRFCDVDGCENIHSAKGLCHQHYSQLRDRKRTQRRLDNLCMCGRPLWRGTKICRSCQRSTIKHGTLHAYDRKGCRCEECRMAKTARVQHIPVSVRKFVYERDKKTCQLCKKPVDLSLGSKHPMSPTLDHIECISWSLIPNNSAGNLRLTHRSCNSSRGARRERVA